jgi:aminoglycoside 2''-phosphotransferase
MDRQMMYVQNIRDVYPDLLIETVRFSGEGQNNDILIINGELIFRFPKYAHALKQLKIEAAILSGIQGYITLNIPNPIYKSIETQMVGRAFIGYRMIPGEPLWRGVLMGIEDDGVLQTLATQLATFLKELHSVPVSEAVAFDLPVSDDYAECTDMYTRFREKLFPYMRPDARDWAENLFEAFLNNRRNFEYQPVLRHGDFGTGNILFDSKMKTINGVIDFGSAGLGDPAVDFAGILCQAGYGEPFLKRFYKIYPEIEFALNRARFYSDSFALQEALFGIENGDIEAFRDGIAPYV